MKKEYCVYVHTNKINGKKYVGITSSKPIVRWANGNGYKTNKHFTFAIKKYGWNNFEHEILLSGLTREQACQWEQALIAQWDTTNPDKGYNIALGGVGTNSVSDETKKKKSIQTSNYFATHPEERKRVRRQMTEYMNRPEIKKRISKRMKKFFAEHPEKKTKKKIWQYDFNGEYICEWASAVDAEREAGYDRKKISACLTGHQKTACGYLWKYADDSKPTKIKGFTPKQKKPEKPRKYKRYSGVEQYDRNGNWMRSFETILEATQVTGICHSCIIRCCKGRGHTAGGYQWRYSIDKVAQLEKKSKWQKFRVAQYDMEGHLVKIYESVKDAEKTLGLKHPSKISYVCNGQRKSCNGYVWRYLDELQNKTI